MARYRAQHTASDRQVWVRTRGTQVLAVNQATGGRTGKTGMEAGWPVVLRATRAVRASRLKVSFWICFCDSVWRRPLFRRVWICFKDERLPAGFSWGYWQQCCYTGRGRLESLFVCLAIAQRNKRFSDSG
jgi:hypothetical protein